MIRHPNSLTDKEGIIHPFVFTIGVLFLIISRKSTIGKEEQKNIIKKYILFGIEFIFLFILYYKFIKYDITNL